MALELKKYTVRLKLLEDMLGTVPKNKEVYASYIATKAADHADKERKRAAKDTTHVPSWANGDAIGNDGASTAVAERTPLTVAAEEVETVQQIEEKGWTGFHKDDHGIFVHDYFVKGFLCEAARTLKEINSVKQLQDKFKRYVFVRPRRIYLAESGEHLERPLRAMTALGPRVTVTRSDLVKAGSDIGFTVAVLHGGGITPAILRDVLSYGELIGFGQWRSGGYGRFELVELTAE